MIAKFKRNEGGIYEDPVLTEDIANHKATLEYCTFLEDYMAEKIKGNEGKFNLLINKDIDFEMEDRDGKGKTTTKKRQDGGFVRFARPQFNSAADKFRGETIALNDIWATEVNVMSVKFDEMNYKIKYQVTLWDHFGLDITDIEDIPNTVPLAKEAFTAWFACNI